MTIQMNDPAKDIEEKYIVVKREFLSFFDKHILQRFGISKILLFIYAWTIITLALVFIDVMGISFNV